METDQVGRLRDILEAAQLIGSYVKDITEADFHANKEKQDAVIRRIEIIERARRLLETHPLRATDSLQLAAALLTSEENPRGFPFVTLDRRLGGAAEREGFHVLGV